MTDQDLPGVFVHPNALVESKQIGAGTRVWAFAHVLKGAIVGKKCNLCDHTYVECGAILGNKVTVKNQVAVWDGVTLEDEVFVGPNVTFTNVRNPRAAIKIGPTEFQQTLVQRGATLGAGAVIVCDVDIGEYAFVAAGAVVTRDVLPFQLVAGNPARPMGWICSCGRRLRDNLECGTCPKVYEASKDGSRIYPV